MALEVKLLGFGTYNASTTNQELLNRLTDNAVPAGKAVIIKSIRLVNTHASAAATVTLNANDGTNHRLVSNKEFSLGAKAMYADSNEITLEATHKLRMTLGSGGGPVEFVVSGIMRDA